MQLTFKSTRAPLTAHGGSLVALGEVCATQTVAYAPVLRVGLDLAVLSKQMSATLLLAQTVEYA